MGVKDMKVSDDEDIGKEQPVKKNDSTKENVEPSDDDAVEASENAIEEEEDLGVSSEPFDPSDDTLFTDGKLDVEKLAKIMQESGETALRDALMSAGYTLAEVDECVENTHAHLKKTTALNGKGLYVSGGAENLESSLQEVDLTGMSMEDVAAAEKSEKKGKKQKEQTFENPVEEVLSMLKEGQALPIVLAKRLIGSEANWAELLKKENVKTTKYQVLYERPD